MSWSQLFVWWSSTFDGPFAVLIFMLFGLVLTLYFADVNVGQMFKDDKDQASAHQFVIFGSWVFGSGYILADLQANKKGSWILFAIYLAVFSGSAAVTELIAKWDGRTPWSKP